MTLRIQEKLFHVVVCNAQNTLKISTMLSLMACKLAWDFCSFFFCMSCMKNRNVQEFSDPNSVKSCWFLE